MTGNLLFGGDKLKIKATADEGNYVKSLSVDGKEIFTNDDTSITETVQEYTVPNIWPTVYVAPEKKLEVVPVFDTALSPITFNFLVKRMGTVNYDSTEDQGSVIASTYMHATLHNYIINKVSGVKVNVPDNMKNLFIFNDLPSSAKIEYIDDPENDMFMELTINQQTDITSAMKFSKTTSGTANYSGVKVFYDPSITLAYMISVGGSNYIRESYPVTDYYGYFYNGLGYMKSGTKVSNATTIYSKDEEGLHFTIKKKATLDEFIAAFNSSKSVYYKLFATTYNRS